MPKVNTKKMPKTCPLCGGTGEAKADLASRVIWLRKEAKLSQAEFADRVGVKRSTITNIETGRHQFTPDGIVAVCNAFGVSSDWLLGLH